jgi:hypothetical protein
MVMAMTGTPHVRGILIGLAGAVVLPCLSAPAGVAAEPETAAAEIVAAQVRSQGHACTRPVTAVREASRPNVTVWLLSCANARYRVRLVPDMAAQITQLK